MLCGNCSRSCQSFSSCCSNGRLGTSGWGVRRRWLNRRTFSAGIWVEENNSS